MKYCPYCGVSLSGSAASFCPECGKALRAKARGSHSVGRRRPSPEKKAQSEREKPQRSKNPMDENYDGYYNDVKPIDADQIGKQHDPDLVKRVIGVIAGTLGIIVLAVILMTVL